VSLGTANGSSGFPAANVGPEETDSQVQQLGRHLNVADDDRQDVRVGAPAKETATSYMYLRSATIVIV
jgi:hypothetical protein